MGRRDFNALCHGFLTEDAEDDILVAVDAVDLVARGIRFRLVEDGIAELFGDSGEVRGDFPLRFIGRHKRHVICGKAVGSVFNIVTDDVCHVLLLVEELFFEDLCFGLLFLAHGGTSFLSPYWRITL